MFNFAKRPKVGDTMVLTETSNPRFKYLEGKLFYYPYLKKGTKACLSSCFNDDALVISLLKKITYRKEEVILETENSTYTLRKK